MREKMEMKTHTLAVVVTAGWPMALTLMLMCAMVLAIFPKEQAWLVVGLLTGFVALTYLWCMKMYLGAYVFLPPTEYKGARLLARLGRHESETEISGVSRASSASVSRRPSGRIGQTRNGRPSIRQACCQGTKFE